MNRRVVQIADDYWHVVDDDEQTIVGSIFEFAEGNLRWRAEKAKLGAPLEEWRVAYCGSWEEALQYMGVMSGEPINWQEVLLHEPRERKHTNPEHHDNQSEEQPPA